MSDATARWPATPAQPCWQLIKGSDTNVWTISLSADKNTLTYHLDRHAKPRVEAVLKRVAR